MSSGEPGRRTLDVGRLMVVMPGTRVPGITFVGDLDSGVEARLRRSAVRVGAALAYAIAAADIAEAVLKGPAHPVDRRHGYHRGYQGNERCDTCQDGQCDRGIAGLPRVFGDGVLARAPRPGLNRNHLFPR